MTVADAALGSAPRPRPTWRAVAVPSEHGGWGLTLEPAVLGILLAPSGAGVAIGVVALLAFLARTPAKLALVDRRRRRRLARTALAERIASLELVALAAVAASAVALSGLGWVVPIALAAPLFGVELWFDVRSRGRRLVPELCGAVGVAAVAAASVVAGGGGARLAAGAWLLLAGRSVASIPYVRVELDRVHGRAHRRRAGDAAGVTGLGIAIGAAVVAPALWPGAVAVGAAVLAQVVWARRPGVRAVRVGVRQTVAGLAVVAAAAVGKALLG